MSLTSNTFSVKLTLEVLNADGTPFCKNETTYGAMPYAAMVAIERKMVNLLSDLVALGEAAVAASAEPATPVAPAANPAVPV